MKAKPGLGEAGEACTAPNLRTGSGVGKRGVGPQERAPVRALCPGTSLAAPSSWGNCPVWWETQCENHGETIGF